MKRKRLNQFMAGLLAATMVVTTVVSTPVQADAKSKTMTVSTQQQLNLALKTKGVRTIVIKTGKEKNLAVKAGNYGKITLKVDAPKLKLTNKGKFSKIVVKDAASIVESKTGNTYSVTDEKVTLSASNKVKIKTVNYASKKGVLSLKGKGKFNTVNVKKPSTASIMANAKNTVKVNVAKEASVGTVAVTDTSQKVDIVTKGEVKKVNVTKAATVTISGATKSAVQVNVTAKDATVEISVPAKITLKEGAEIVLKPGSEGTTIDASKSKDEPVIKNETDAPIQIIDKNGTTIEVQPGESVGDASNSNNGTENNSSSPAQGPSLGSGSGVGSSGSQNNQTVQKDLSYEGYKLKWQDEFEGTGLNRDDWNVETHEPGWVNSELQAYVDSTDNIQVKDGKLVIKPIKKVGADGEVTYTSGRVNTQNKHDFKYGLFEARVKVPKGAGYLPAFWMMPTDENLYGQWPKCGEIDCMEVMGQENDKVYGTIHYGDPHSENQGTYKLTSGNYTDEFHTFSCEWKPGKITWYMDGIKYFETDDWYSTKQGQGTVTYPAPFDQPFYMILNLAVGGSWVGNPDGNTTFDDQEFVVDYVKAYQRDNYDENVKKPIKEVVLRDPDAKGNYINNGDFSVDESLTDDADWKFMTALEGEATASIANKTMTVDTTKEGTVDYSVQLVQAGVPLKKGATYEVSFDAKAAEAREMNVAIKAPDRGYTAYMSQNVDLTTEYKTYTYDFIMESDDDANGRLEYNMGSKGSTAAIDIKNVKIKKINDANPNGLAKKVLADGNYVYNGKFQEGEGRLGDWTISDGIQASVTSLEDGRRLKAVVTKEGASISQKDLAFTSGRYALSLDAQYEGEGEGKVSVKVADADTVSEVVVSRLTSVAKKLNVKADGSKDFELMFDKVGTYYIDNVMVQEDAMIKNGSFNGGFTGFECYNDASANVEFGVDSLTEDNAAGMTISNTGVQDWMIQLKQNNVELENGKWYKLKFKVKADRARNIMYAIQRDGSGDDDWTPYTGSQIVELDGTDKYTEVELDFQMKNDTDKKSIFTISLGAVGGTQITEKHTVYVDDIELRELAETEIPKIEPKEYDIELFADTTFAEEKWNYNKKGDDTVTVSEGVMVFDIVDLGKDPWDVELKQAGIQVEEGECYQLTYDIESSVDRKVVEKVQEDGGAYELRWGEDDVYLKAGEKRHVEKIFKSKATDGKAVFAIDMGGSNMLVANGTQHTIKISNVSLKKIHETEVSKPEENPFGNPEDIAPEGVDFDHEMIEAEKWTTTCSGGESVKASAAATPSEDGKSITFAIDKVGDSSYGVEYVNKHIRMDKDGQYKVTFKIKSSIDRVIEAKFQHDGAVDGQWGGATWSKKVSLKAGEETTVTKYIKFAGETESSQLFAIDMGKFDGTEDITHSIIISDVSIMKAGEPSEEESEVDIISDCTKWSLSKNGGEAEISSQTKDGIQMNIISVGDTEDSVALKYEGFKYDSSKKYCLSFEVNTESEKAVKPQVFDVSGTDWVYLGGYCTNVSPSADGYTKVEIWMDPQNKGICESALVRIALGKIADDEHGSHPNPTGTLKIKNIKLEEVPIS